MACANRTQHQALDESSATLSQTELENMGAVAMEQDGTWLILASPENRIVAAPLSSETPGNEWEMKYSVQDNQGKTILLYKADTFRSDQLPPGHHFITGDGIERSIREKVEEVWRSMLLEKNPNLVTDFESSKQYCTTEGESVDVITCNEFNRHMESLIVLEKENGQLIPRRIPKSMLTPGAERIPDDDDQRLLVAQCIAKLMKGIPDANLDPLPVVSDILDKAKKFSAKDKPSNDECSGSSEEPEPVPVGSAAAVVNEPVPVAGLDEQPVCTAAGPCNYSPEAMGIFLTIGFRHMRTSCDRSNVMCSICIAVMGMFIHVLGCRCPVCPQKQLIAQGFAKHVTARRCASSPCSIPFCKDPDTHAIVRDEDIYYPSAYLIGCILLCIIQAFEHLIS